MSLTWAICLNRAKNAYVDYFCTCKLQKYLYKSNVKVTKALGAQKSAKYIPVKRK